MESYKINTWLGSDKYRQEDGTIMDMLYELFRESQEFNEEECEWEYIWEYITMIFGEIKLGEYCVEPFHKQIIDAYQENDLGMPSETYEENQETLARLKELKLPEQRTPEWFKFRQGRLTASELSYCIQGKAAIKKKIILQKLHPEAVPYISSAATTHGTMYEPVAQYMYEVLYNTTLHEFGCIPHLTVDWLAASPDGISEEGVMVEIKCPYSRKPIGVPSLTYYTQIQAQLEVCDLHWCDFMECEIHTYDDNRSGYIRDTAEKGSDNVKRILKNAHYKGIKREYLPKDTSGILKGVSMAVETDKGVSLECIMLEDMRKMTSKEWIERTLSKHEPIRGYTVKYWILRQIWITRIQRNPEWFEMIMEKGAEFWEEVQRKKIEGVEVPVKQKMEFVEEV